MITSIQICTLHVSDQQQALAFWRDVLGFEVRDDKEFMPEARWITVGPPGGQASFVLWPKDVGAKVDEVGGFTGYSLTCDDIEHTVAELTARGVSFTQAIRSEDWGKHTMFADPDGNLFSLVQPT
jgi:catechol 2,3-dioxygenase-like lactoylglutathione lyase family enzyme